MDCRKELLGSLSSELINFLGSDKRVLLGKPFLVLAPVVEIAIVVFRVSVSTTKNVITLTLEA